jgi:hypothetical protein
MWHQMRAVLPGRDSSQFQSETILTGTCGLRYVQLSLKIAFSNDTFLTVHQMPIGGRHYFLASSRGNR